MSSPATRRLAEHFQIDPSEVGGSGPSGRVLVDDLLRYLARRTGLRGSRFIQLEGRAVHLADVGQGPAVILLHGAGGSNWSWVPVLGRLAARYRLLAPDFPGCGWSEAVEGDYSLDFYVDFVVSLLRALEITRAHVVGCSLGGAVAVRTALRHPGLVDHLVLADPAGLGDWVHPDLYRSLLHSDRPEGARATLQLLFHNPRLVTHGLVDETLRQRRRPGAMEALRKTVGSLMEPGQQLIDLRPELARLAQPVLMIWGRQDRVTLLEQAEAAVRDIPRLSFQVVDECGHVPQAEQPAAFAKLVRGFLPLGSPSAPQPPENGARA